MAGHWQDLTAKTYSASDMDQIEPALKALGARKLASTAYSSPEWLSALLHHRVNPNLATVSQNGDLYFALPINQSSLPLPLAKNAISPLGGTGLPLIDSDLPEAAWEAFLAGQGKPVLLSQVPTDGAFFKMIESQSDRFAILDQWQRAGIRPSGTFDNWLEQNFDKKRRKEYRRLRNRLAEEGDLQTEQLTAGADCKPWLDNLLALEAAGWKGQRGTALGTEAKLMAALHDAAAALHAQGKFRMWRLVLNGKTLASMYGIIDSEEAWLGKIAHDENFAKYSPGVMLIFDATEALFAEENIRVVDSCAIPGHPMIENIWRDRIGMADVMVAASCVSKAQFKFTLAVEKLRRRVRSFVRDIYYKLRGRHRS